MNKIFRKTLAMILALAMVLSSLVVVSAESASDFSDFPTGWSAEAMTAAVHNGLLYGMGDGTIAPKANLTRAQMAAIINRAFGATVQADISAFGDVSSDAWYYNDVAKAVNMGTFAGVSDNSMNPEADITRQEAFAVMARALVLEAKDSSALSRFGDGQSVSSWAVSDVCALIERGYVNGYTDGLLCPTANITREEFAQMMHNIIKTYISEPGDVSKVNAGDCVMIRTPGVTIHDVKIEGDLILGDGVGKGDVNITNVEIGGRLLCRGGEGKVTLKNTVTGEGVVVKDVNGVVNFNNYRSESVFDGVREITKATYLDSGAGDDKDGNKINIGPVTGGTGSGSGSGGIENPDKFKVVFYYDEACTEKYKTLEIEDGKTITTLPDDPSKTGRTFAGWFYRDSDGKEKEFDTSVKITDDMKVYAKWNTTIKFFKDSSMTDEVKEFKDFPFGKTFKEAGIAIPEKPDNQNGEEFAGWFYKDEDGKEKEFTEDTPVTEEMKIYAKWGVFVTFYDHYNETDKYVSQIGEPVEVEKGQSLEKAKFPWDKSDDKDDTRQFAGWYYLDDSGVEKEFTETTPVYESVKVYGKWNTTLKFYKDSGLTDEVEEFKDFPYGKTFKEAGISIPQKPSGVTDEEFAGWFYKDENGKELEFTEDTPVTKNLSIYAKWGVFVTFYDHYDETDKYVFQIGEPIEIEKGQSLEKAKFPWDKSDDMDDTRQFVGWFYLNDSNEETEFTETVVIQKAVKVYGKWETKINFYKDSTLAEEACDPIVLPYGKSFADAGFTLPAKPDYDESEDFAGWFYEDAGQVKEFTQNTVVTENMTVFAKWGAIVIFYDHYDETADDKYITQLGDPVEIIKGESFAESGKTLPDIDETERTHEGWFYLDDNGTEVEFTVNTVVNSVMKVYGKWTVTVSFWDGYTLQPELNIKTLSDVAYGSTVTDIPDNKSYNGYVKNASVHSIYTEEETHHIMTDWWYLKENEDGTAEWTVFDDSVKIIKNTDVFRMVKNISVDLDGELIEKLEAKLGEEAFVSIPYSPDTRLNDSVKDLVWSLRNRVDYALRETDAYDRLIERLTSVNDKVLDADKNILNQALSIKIIEVIAADEIEGEIKNYITTVVKHGGEELKTLLSFVDISELIDAVGTDYIINSLDDETLLSILRKDNVRPTAVSVLKKKIASDATIRAEVIGFFVDRLENDPNFLAWFIDFIRTEVKAGNDDVINPLAEYLRGALMTNGDLQDMAISIFIDKLKTSGDFRNTIISNDAFLTSVLNDATLKTIVVDSIVGHTELIKELVKEDAVRNDIITSLEQNKVFLDFIVHHEYFEKEFVNAVKKPAHAADIKAVLDAHPEMSEEIVEILLKNTEFKKSFKDKDGDVHKLIVEQFKTGIADSDSAVHKLVLDKAMSNQTLRDKLASDNSVKSQLIGQVKTNEEVLKLIRVAVGIGENDSSLDSEIAAALDAYITNPDGEYEVFGTDYIPLIDAEVVKIIKGTTDVSDGIKSKIKAELSAYIAAHIDDANVAGIVDDYISGYADDPAAADSAVKEQVNSSIADRVTVYLDDTDDTDDSAAERKLDGFISSAMIDYAQAVITSEDALDADIESAIESVKSTCINSLLHSAVSTEAEALLNSFLTDKNHKQELIDAVSSDKGYEDIVKYIIANNDNPQHAVVKTGNDFFKDNADSIPEGTIKSYLTNNKLDSDFVKLLLTKNIDSIDDSVISTYVLGNLEELKGIIDTFVVTAINNNKPGFDAIIDDYILNALNIQTVTKFRKLFTDDPDIALLIKDYVGGDPDGAIEDVIDVISKMTDTEKAQFVDKVMVTLRSLSYYQEFVNSFKNGDDTFIVNADNISFVMGVATAIKNYTYDSLRDRIRARFGQVIDLFGEDLIRQYFNNATQDYYSGVLAIKNQIDADKAAGIDKDYEYTTSLTFKANLMKDILVPKYDAIMSKAIAKLEGAGKGGYDNNKHLKALVEMNLVEELFEELPTGATETLSGYKLKDDPMAYYDFVYALLVLADDAVLFYDYVSYDDVVNRITPHAVKLANKSLELLKEFDADGSLPGNIDDKLSSIDRIKGIYDSIEGIMNSVTDIIIGSDADKEYEDETVKNDAVKAATKFINAFWKQLNEYNESGELPEKLQPVLDKSAKLKKIFEENKDNLDALVEKIAKLKMNHVYTEEEVAAYEKYVKHLYGMLNGTADPTFSIDTVYEIAEFFADDLLAGFKFTPDEIEGYVYIDAYHTGLKGVIGSVVRFFA